MNQIKLARWLKCILAVACLCALIMYAAVIPAEGLRLQAAYPEFSNRFLPWLIFLWISGIPCFAALVLAWRIVVNIGKDRSFSMDNARLLQWISRLAAGDAVFFFLGNVLLLLLNMSHPGVVLAALVIVFVGVAVAVAAAVLSYLVQKATALQEQSDLTI